MKRHVLIAVGALAIAIGVLGPPSSALAAIDATTTSVSCSPASVATGKATTCTATVTDTEASPLSTPAGTAIFSSAPSTGTFSGNGTCNLSGSGATSSCALTFTPSAGGDYAVNVAYGGDTDHTGSNGSDSPTAVDTTTTTMTCSPSVVQISTSTNCTATLTDAHATQPPLGEIDFGAAPTTGAFGTPGICQWQPSGSGTGGSATCHITFTPSAPGAYSLSADYTGDSSHGVSVGKFALTATTTPANGGPGSHGGGGSSSVVIGGSGGPPPPGTVTISKRARVKHKHAGLQLSCAGQPGASCNAALTLTTKTKVKVKVKTKVKVHVPGKRRGKGKGRTKGKVETRTKVTIKHEVKTVLVGTVVYGVAAGTTQTLSIKLSRPALKLLAKGHHGKLKAQALVDGAFVRNVTVGGKVKKHRHKHHRGHKQHKK